MEKLIDETIASRMEIRDYETVLKLKWLAVSNLTDEEKLDKHLEYILATR